VVKVRDVVKAIEADGWYLVRHKGSHRHFQHSIKGGTVTVPGHPGDEMAPKTLGSIWKQAKLKGAR
jgi:predicted RNA binding protein YcfA (HicA-like mRNA interferase family)